tara:strand:+ start:143 stop:556 length:414 start_codon:yes stop_codon:yes gene_type:complete
MRKILLILLFQLSFSSLFADIFVFKNCKSSDYKYQKNEYILNLKQGMMIREFIYDEESYKKLRLNDITVKKENTTSKGIVEENNLIVSEISGYPAFYTQMIFDKKDGSVKIKTVLNNTEGVSLVSKCEDVINFKKES